MLFGRDEILLAGLSMGAKGAVGSTYNYASQLYHALIAAYERNDFKTAQQLQDRSIEIVKVLTSTNASEIAVNKVIMKYYAGIDCGPARVPLGNLTKEQTDSIKKSLDRLEQ